MFWNFTVRRLGGTPVDATFPRTYGARPDLETGERLLVIATEGGILLTRCAAPTPRATEAGPATPRFRSTVNAPLR
jgi:hypothetical protein